MWRVGRMSYQSKYYHTIFSFDKHLSKRSSTASLLGLAFLFFRWVCATPHFTCQQGDRQRLPAMLSWMHVRSHDRYMKEKGISYVKNDIHLSQSYSKPSPARHRIDDTPRQRRDCQFPIAANRPCHRPLPDTNSAIWRLFHLPVSSSLDRHVYLKIFS